MSKQITKTVLITGSSTGIGRETALYFQKKGWNVAATMRTPSKEIVLNKLENTIVPSLDVMDSKSIREAIQSTISKFGKIDAIVNNAGYGLVGPFEGASESQIKKQYDTNVFGLMNVMREMLPHFRTNKNGVFVNVASMGGRVVFPYYSLYHGTKWAVEGFTESLRFELEPLGIRVKIVEPGAIKTDFYERSMDNTMATSPIEYKALCDKAFANYEKSSSGATLPEKVAKVIFKAADDGSKKLRYAVGPDAKSLLFLRNILPDGIYAKMIKLALL